MENKKAVVIKLESGNKYQRLLAGSPQTAGMRSGHVNLMQGEEIGEHSTDNKEEAIIILNGKAQVLSEKSDPITAESECLIYIPANTKHNIKNIGQGVLQYVYVVSELK
ncbi:MAG: cupin domain-containing protein [Candidatus Omnitrophota bacterium]